MPRSHVACPPEFRRQMVILTHHLFKAERKSQFAGRSLI